MCGVRLEIRQTHARAPTHGAHLLSVCVWACVLLNSSCGSGCSGCDGRQTQLLAGQPLSVAVCTTYLAGNRR